MSTDEHESKASAESVMASPTQSGTSVALSSSSDITSSHEGSSPTRVLIPTIPRERTKSDASSSTPSVNTSSSLNASLTSKKDDSMLTHSSEEDATSSRDQQFECFQLSGDVARPDVRQPVEINLQPSSPSRLDSTPTSCIISDKRKGRPTAGPAGLPKWVKPARHSPFSSSEELGSSIMEWSPSQQFSKPQSVVADSQPSPSDSMEALRGFATSTQATTASGSGRKSQFPAVGDGLSMFPPLVTQLSEKEQIGVSPSEPNISQSSSAEAGFQLWPSGFEACDRIAETPPEKLGGSPEAVREDNESLGSQDLFELGSQDRECSEAAFELSAPSVEESAASIRTISLKRRHGNSESSAMKRKKPTLSVSQEDPVEWSGSASVVSTASEVPGASATSERTSCQNAAVVEMTMVVRCGDRMEHVQLFTDETEKPHPGLPGLSELHVIQKHFQRVVKNMEIKAAELDEPQQVVQEEMTAMRQQEHLSLEDSETSAIDCQMDPVLECGSKVFAKQYDMYYYPGMVTEIIDPSRSVGRLCEVSFLDGKVLTVSANDVVVRDVLVRGQKVLYYDQPSKAYLVGIVNICSSKGSESEMYEIQTEDNGVQTVPRSSIILSEQHARSTCTTQEDNSDDNASLIEIRKITPRRKSSRVLRRRPTEKLPKKAAPATPELMHSCTLFSGMFFLITHEKRKGKDSASGASDVSSGCSLYSDETFTEEEDATPMYVDSLKLQILHGGGTVLEEYTVEELVSKKEVYCISNTYQQTPKYLICLTCDVPVVSVNWISNSCEANMILNVISYLLPRGRSYLTKELVEKGLEKDPMRNKHIYIHGNKRRCDQWTFILSGCGCVLVKSIAKHGSMDFQCDVAVVGKKSITPTLLKRIKQRKIPMVNFKWLVHCLVVGKWVDTSAHDVFSYKTDKTKEKKT